MGGEIEVADAPNGAFLRTMGGDIDIVQLEGSADAGTMGGDIRVTVVGSGGGHDLDLHSMGGDIEVFLPHDFSADFAVELVEDDDDEPLRRRQILSRFAPQDKVETCVRGESDAPRSSPRSSSSS
ncbi:MAG: hypothetical protein AABO58_08320 [Acidobacteriota bacterium]